MRKTFLLPLILWATMLVLFSCQKESIENESNDQLISKVNNWLDKQKSPTEPNKAANIDLLKDNLNFTEQRFEDLNQNEKFLIIPVNEDYETKKNIDKKTVLVLLLVMDKSANIIRGNLVLYSPEDNQGLNEIPKHTFFKMYNNKSLDCNGLFNFLSVTGRRMYQREYKGGKLHSFGYVKASNNKPDEASNQAVARTETDCTHYFYILTWWIDGVPVYQEAIYLGSICAGACDDPNNHTLCPDGGGGGGGGSGGIGTEEPCCIPDPNAQVSVTIGSESEWQCAGEGTDPISGNPTKGCIHKWSFQHNSLLWYSWDFISLTFAEFEKISGDWYFKSTPTFQGVTTSGQLPACLSSKCTSTSANISLGAHRRSGTLLLTYTIETMVTCFRWSQPRYDVNTVEATLIPPA